MKRLFVNHATFFGALFGIVFFTFSSIVGKLGQDWVITHLLHIHFRSISFRDEVATELIIAALPGVLTGRCCGLAAQAWYFGNKRRAKNYLRIAGDIGTAIGLIVFVSSCLSGDLRIYRVPRGSTGQDIARISECYFGSFWLQIGIFLLILSRFLPYQSRESALDSEIHRL